jgi:hypothetical protein
MTGRRISTDDWTPPPGTVKRICAGTCKMPFASRDGARVCPTCTANRRIPDVSPFDPSAASAPRGLRPSRRPK